MSNSIAQSPRPVSLVTALLVLALFAGFALVVTHYYTPAATAPQNQQAENLPKDLEWKATPASRQNALADLHKRQAMQAASYAWIDEKAGVIQLPVQRAMELTVQRYGAQK